MKTKHISIITGIVLMTVPLLPVTATALPCVNGSLQSYISLGAQGCSIDDKIFSNFQYSTNLPFNQPGMPPPPGATFLENHSPSDISVVPLFTASNPGLQFLGGWGVDDGAVLIFSVGFTVTVLPGGGLIEDESLLLLEGSMRFSPPAGRVDLIQQSPGLSVCPPPGTGFCGPPFPPFPGQLSATTTFTPVSTVAVNLTGDVAKGIITGFQEKFSEVVPEPATFLLLGSGFAGLVLWRRFRMNTHCRTARGN